MEIVAGRGGAYISQSKLLLRPVRNQSKEVKTVILPYQPTVGTQM